ncbi:7TM-DISM domain-containing protein [Oceanobacter antarcticus]|uniref:histidine kinase n=1 Tax=Oceanobacter antarcticus TaxID=3133425 RepID=A0ABW8NEJ3_9GAMM
MADQAKRLFDSSWLAGLLWLLWLLCLSNSSWASSPVLIPESDFNHSISSYVSILEDPESSLSIDDILTQQVQLRFTPSHSENLHFGVSHSTFWLRISLYNPFPIDKQVILALSNNHIPSVSMFDISHGDAIAVVNGFTAPSGSYQQAHPFLLTLPAMTTQSYLLSLSSGGLINTDVRLMTPQRFLQNEQCQSILIGLVAGWLMATAAYFINLALTRRSWLAWCASGYCLASTVFMVSWLGQLGLLLNLDLEHSEIVTELATGLTMACQSLAVYFLGWKGQHARLFRQILLGCTGLSILGTILLTSLPGSYSETLAPVLVMLMQLVLSILLGIGSSRHPSAQRWFLTGTMANLGGVLLILFISNNLLEFDSINSWMALLLPSVMTACMVMAVLRLTRKSDQFLESPNRGVAINPAILSQISHELRTPINGVLGMNELLSDTPLTDGQRDFTETIAQAGREMLHVANEISVLAKIQDDHLELDTRAFDLVSLTNQVLVHFQLEANRKQVELMVDQEEDLPARLVGDRNRLQTLLHNLYARLLAYTEQGEISTHLSPLRSNRGQVHGVSIQIQLHGTITNRDDLRIMLDLLCSTHQSNGETPWNLTVSRHLIRFMKASLEMESLTTQAGSLTLYLPLEPESAETSIQPGHDDSLIGMHILIVDDNASLRKVIEKQIRRWGVRVESTYSGKEALAMLRNQAATGHAFDGAIIDQDMPVMNGLELMQRIQDDASISPKPNVLMLTGLSISSVREQAHAVGIYHLLAKPASGERLKRALLELKYRPQRPSSTH